MEKKVLTLSVKKEWFDKILSGEKKEEYREIKPYWGARLYYDRFGKLSPEMVKELAGSIVKYGDTEHFEAKNGIEVSFVPFTHVLFINGYGDDKPRVEKEIEWIDIDRPRKGWCPDDFLGKEFFVIKFK
jgi:hypothetical protein|nr:hypothetical protein [uncultured Prevotella sp.]DAV55018.1 MAG TPA: ASCH domain protein [Caudoviricetes sp.]